MIIVLVGFSGSGKSTLGKFLYKNLKGIGFNFLEISSVVKELLNYETRKEVIDISLEKNKEDPLWLSEVVKDRLLTHKDWIISGTREMAVLDSIRDIDNNVKVIYLECRDTTRLKRCKDKPKNMASLLRIDERDLSLGLDNVLLSSDCAFSTEGLLKDVKLRLLDYVETLSGMSVRE